jgi:glucose/arabinose dehydrogenase
VLPLVLVARQVSPPDAVGAQAFSTRHWLEVNRQHVMRWTGSLVPKTAGVASRGTRSPRGVLTCLSPVTVARDFKQDGAFIRRGGAWPFVRKTRLAIRHCAPLPMHHRTPLTRRPAALLPGLLLALPLTACGGGNGGGTAARAPEAAGSGVRAVTVAEGLDHPWSVAFLPDGRFLVTERAGRLRLVGTDGRLSTIEGLPPVRARGQGGLFDVVLGPDFARDRRIYWSYAEPGRGAEEGRDGLAVARGTLDLATGRVQQVEVILRQTPKVAGSSGHYGGRLVFAPDGRLFVTMGDRQIGSERVHAQDLSRDNGKIARIEADGRIPPDNPFTARAGARGAIWSLGHRNAQGMAFQPGTGALWITEHGPQGGDELNAVAAGRNYGWPRVSHGCEYGAPVGDCTVVGGASTAPGFEAPRATWVPTSTAPSGLMFYNGERFPEWRGQAFTGALTGRTLWRLQVDGTGPIVCTPPSGATASGCGQVEAVRALDRRIRDVRQGPDGWIYLLTDDGGGQDALLRLQR